MTEIIPYFDKLPIKYQTIVNDLMIDLNKTEDTEIKKQFINKFADRYTMVPELWQYLYTLQHGHESKLDVVKKSLKHFIHDKFIEDFNLREFDELRKSFKWNFVEDVKQSFQCSFIITQMSIKAKEDKILTLLSFPHAKIDEILKLHEEFLGPIPKNVFDMAIQNKAHYDELIEHYEINPQQFYNLALKIDDKLSQCQNIELLLSTRPFDHKMWRDYIEVIEERNLKQFLEVARRYLGIFFNDYEMIYRVKNVEKLFEMEELKLQIKKPRLSPSEEIPDKFKMKHILGKFTFENAIVQAPPFRPSLNSYIYKNLSSISLIKLQMVCKNMLQCFPQRVIQRLEMHNTPKNYHKNSVNISQRDKLYLKLNNIFLSNSMHITASINFSTLIEKIYHCDLKYLRLRIQTLSLKDYNILVQSGNLKLIELIAVDIVAENSQNVSPEILLAKCPKLCSIYITPAHLSGETFKNLQKLKFQSKIYSFKLEDISGLIDIASSIEFFKQNLSPNAKCDIEYVFDAPVEHVDEFDTAVKAMQDSWEPKEETPAFEVSMSPD